jgi:DNA-binding MarR family transcriptional regulator
VRDLARDVLAVVPLVMRAVAAELRAGGELPAPAHFGLLTVLARQPSTVSALAQGHGVSLPTMSNSVSALIKRGWARRTPSPDDRRVLIVEATPAGRAMVARVGRAAQQHLAEQLAHLDRASARRLREGLAVLRAVFGAAPCGPRAASARNGTPRAEPRAGRARIYEERRD